jgi:phosphotransferase system  glucose/maltose/N-acetylglucosamine-specific IIC component
MDNPFDGFTSKEMKQELLRRKDSASKCRKDFRETHGNPISKNLFFLIPVALCTVLSGFLSVIALTVLFIDQNSWTNTFTGGVFMFLICFSLMSWVISHENRTARAFRDAYPKEAQELGMS